MAWSISLGLLHCLPMKQHLRIHKIKEKKKEEERKQQLPFNTITTVNRLQRGMQVHIWSLFPFRFFLN